MERRREGEPASHRGPGSSTDEEMVDGLSDEAGQSRTRHRSSKAGTEDTEKRGREAESERERSIRRSGVQGAMAP